MQKLNETETRKLLIDPALEKAGWNFEYIKLEYGIQAKDYEFSDGEMKKDGKRKSKKKADYVLFHKEHYFAVIEAKANDKNQAKG